jgi:hypothetical protein
MLIVIFVGRIVPVFWVVLPFLMHVVYVEEMVVHVLGVMVFHKVVKYLISVVYVEVTMRVSIVLVNLMVLQK